MSSSLLEVLGVEECRNMTSSSVEVMGVVFVGWELAISWMTFHITAIIAPIKRTETRSVMQATSIDVREILDKRSLRSSWNLSASSLQVGQYTLSVVEIVFPLVSESTNLPVTAHSRHRYVEHGEKLCEATEKHVSVSS